MTDLNGIWERWLRVIHGEVVGRRMIDGDWSDGGERSREEKSFNSHLNLLGADRMIACLDVFATGREAGILGNRPHRHGDLPALAGAMPIGDGDADVMRLTYLLGVAFADTPCILRCEHPGGLRVVRDFGAMGFDWTATMLESMFVHAAELGMNAGGIPVPRGHYGESSLVHMQIIEALEFMDDRGRPASGSDPEAFGRALADAWSRILGYGYDDDALRAFAGDFAMFRRWEMAVSAAGASAPACASTVSALFWLLDFGDHGDHMDRRKCILTIVSALESGAEPDYSAFRDWLRFMDMVPHPIPMDAMHEVAYPAVRGVLPGVEAMSRMRSPGRILGILHAYDMLITADGGDPTNPGDRFRRPSADGRDMGYRPVDVRRGIATLEKGMPLDMAVETMSMHG